ncbi:MAG: glutamate racemase [Hyphomicrobiaceae bacterium]
MPALVLPGDMVWVDMIGLFDSGHGGLTVLRLLVERFPEQSFVYLGDHGNAPYGNRPADEIVDLTRTAVTELFERGARLVLLACNTATCVALRKLQQEWLPTTRWAGKHNVIGIVAPTVEAATQTPWGITSPQYPQMYNADVIAVFATRRTIASDVYRDEVLKRCPRIKLIQQACPDLAGAIEAGAPEADLDHLVGAAVADALEQAAGAPLHRAILGCTHYPLVEGLFKGHLPDHTRILSQAETVADSLEHYLARHQRFAADLGGCTAGGRQVRLLTSGDPAAVAAAARRFWPGAGTFEAWDGRKAE